MLRSIKNLMLLFLVAFPGLLFADVELTPGHCAGYMPVILEYQAKSSESREVSELSGSLHLLQARRDREQAKRYVDNSPLLRELHQSHVSSDFDSDYQFAADIAMQQAAFLGSATAEKIMLQAEEFEALGTQIGNMTEWCEAMLAEASKIGNNRALGSFFESITKGD
ncbi:hypothetical protein E8Q33_03965 [Methylophaga sp. SB9B]|uniref:hypothetical protein n=1 Tax=Methylophaga sp. SB9B TaxID=2570356 RepID=UPI0010A7F1D5|nr:hypothetical protein [Methylophaga sp. SB9B]THK41975.1 hypothetical protein E8Q33_03965 [Methylophaga sp. SB9B]